MESTHKIIKLWTTFGFNYPSDFIEKAFASKDQTFIQHLKSKFELAYEIAGTHGAFFYFWAEMLGDSNKRILEDWVMDNYKG